ncbi:MAG: hypothetical protein WHS89_08935 [Acidimicrobiales bacterium]
MIRRSRLAAFAIAVTLALLVACGEDATTPPATAGGTARDAEALLPPIDRNQTLPPNDLAALRHIYEPALANLGLRLTRGQLIDLGNGSYTPSNTGTHLALYVEPIAEYSDDQYAQGLWDLTALITPDVFARWADLRSYDICQEPLPSVDDNPEPFPVTQVNITREAAATIDWENGSLGDLVRAARANKDLKLVVSRAVRQSAAYKAAVGSADPGTTAPTATTP